LEQKLSELMPREPIIYERVENKIYARYRNKPEIPRWCVNEGDVPTILEYNDWRQMLLLSDSNPVFKKELDKIINLYYLLKDN